MSMTEGQVSNWLKFLIANATNNALAMGLSDRFGAEVMHINSSVPQLLNLSIANTLTENVEIVGRPGPASEDKCHFHIKFVNNECFSSNVLPTVMPSNWVIGIDSDQGTGLITDIYLLSTQNLILEKASAKGNSIVIGMMYPSATLNNPSVQELNIAVSVGQHVNALIPPDSSQPISETTTIHMEALMDAGAPTPLIATLVQTRTVLNDGAEGPSTELLLRLINTSSDPVIFAPPLDKNGPTATEIQFSVDIDATAAWAVCKPDEAKTIILMPKQSAWKGDPGGKVGSAQKTWLFRPDYNSIKQIEPNSAVEFTVSGIKTTLPPGFTNLYVTLREFPYYGTQTLVTQIEKSPLIYNSTLGSGLISSGTAGANHAIALNGNTSSELLLVDQIGAGNSAHFKGGSGVLVEKNLQVNGDVQVDGDVRIDDHDLWLRQGSNNDGLGWFGKGKLYANDSIDGPVLFGNMGGGLGATNGGPNLSLSWDNKGKVGVRSTLVVNSGMALGSTYANQQPPANSVIVQDKLGVGTTKPLGPLSIGDASVPDSDGYIVVGKNIKGGGTRQFRLGLDKDFNFVIGDYGFNNNAGTWIEPFAIAYNALPNSLYIDNTGHTGIGTKKPLGPLSVGDASVKDSDGFIVLGKMSGSGTRQYRLGFDANFNFVIGDYGNNNTAGAWTAPFSMQWLAPTNSLYIDGSGRIGIGTNSPSKAALHVQSSLYTGQVVNGGLCAQDGCYLHTQTVNVGCNWGIYSDGAIWTNGFFIASSDERIKRIHGRSDSADDLSKLLALEVTDYSYIDTLSNGPGTHKKVIAQQVLKVFPQAVTQARNTVPNIYRKAAIKNGWVQLATDLKKGDRVRLVEEKNDGVHEVLEVAEGQFRTDFAAQGDEVFVYGREVDDFLNVDYDAIAMLNVSATQQIKREKDAEVQALREENAALRSRLDRLEKLVHRLVSEDELVSAVV